MDDTKHMSAVSQDITVIMTCDQQGRFLHPSIESVKVAIEQAESATTHGIEWIVVADNPDADTEMYFQNHLPSSARLLRTNTGSIALSINQAVREAKAKYTALISSHDLISANWLSKAYGEIMNGDSQCVLHPGMVVVFGEQTFLFLPYDQQSADFSKDLLFTECLWPTTSLAAREVFLKHPFSRESELVGFGYSYWQWSCNTVAEGIIHRPVGQTFSCCHQYDGHVCVLPKGEKVDAKGIMPSSALFREFAKAGLR